MRVESDGLRPYETVWHLPSMAMGRGGTAGPSCVNFQAEIEHLTFRARQRPPKSAVNTSSFCPPLQTPPPAKPNKSTPLLCLPQGDLACFCSPTMPTIKAFFPLSTLTSLPCQKHFWRCDLDQQGKWLRGVNPWFELLQSTTHLSAISCPYFPLSLISATAISSFHPTPIHVNSHRWATSCFRVPVS